jgi:hypothetical protein
MLCHAGEFLNGADGSWKVGKKWKTTNVSDELRHQNTEEYIEKICEIIDLRVKRIIRNTT